MINARVVLTSAILIVCQAVFNFYLNTGPLIVISCLPAIVLFSSLEKGKITDMIMAFLVGFLCDLLSGQCIGISSLALVPVALLRENILNGFFEDDVYLRGDLPTIQRFGVWKMAAAGFCACIIYLIIFIIADAAGTRTLPFNLGRLVLSLPLCTAITMYIPNLMLKER